MADQVVYRIVVDASQAMRTIDQMTAQSRAAIAELDRIASKPPSRRTKTDLNTAAQTAGAIKGDLVTQKKVAETRGDLQGKAAAERSLRELKTRIDSIFGRGTDESRAFRKIINDSARSFQRNIERSGQNYQLLGISIKDLAEETKRSKAEEKAARREAKAAAKRAAKANEDAAQETNAATAEGKSQRARGKQAAEKKTKAEEKAAEAANKNTQETNKTTEEIKSAGRRVAQATGKSAKAEEQRAEAIQREAVAQRLRTVELDRLSKTQQKNVQSALKKLETQGSRPLNMAEKATVEKLFGREAVAAAEPKSSVDRLRASALRDEREGKAAEKLRREEEATRRKLSRPALVLPEAPTTAAPSRGLYKSAIGSSNYTQQDYDAAAAEVRERRRIASEFARREGIVGPAGSRPGSKGYGVKLLDPDDNVRANVTAEARLADYNKLTKAQLQQRASGLGFSNIDTQGLNKSDLAKLVANQEDARKLVDRAIKDSLTPGTGLSASESIGFIPGTGKGASFDAFRKLQTPDDSARSALDPLAGTVIRSPQTKGENFTAYKVIDGALQQVQTSAGPLSGKTLKDLADNARKALETGEEIAKIDPNQARGLRNLNDRTARTQAIYARSREGIEARLKAGTIDPVAARQDLYAIAKREREIDLRNQAAGNLRPLSDDERARRARAVNYSDALAEANRGKTFQDDGRLPADKVIDPALEAKLTRAQRAAVQKRIEKIQSESLIYTGDVGQSGEFRPNLNRPGRGPIFQGVRSAEDIAKQEETLVKAGRSEAQAAKAANKSYATTARQEAAAEAKRRADEFRRDPSLLAAAAGGRYDPNAITKLIGNGVGFAGGQARPSAATLESLSFKELREAGKGIGVTGKSRDVLTKRINERFGAAFKDLQQNADELDVLTKSLGGTKKSALDDLRRGRTRAAFGFNSEQKGYLDEFGKRPGISSYLPPRREEDGTIKPSRQIVQPRVGQTLPKPRVFDDSARKIIEEYIGREVTPQLFSLDPRQLGAQPITIAARGSQLSPEAQARKTEADRIKSERERISKAQQRDQEQLGRLAQRQEYGKSRGIAIPSDPKLVEEYKKVLAQQQQIPGSDTAGLRKIGKDFGVKGSAKTLESRLNEAVEKRRRELAKLVQQLNDEAIRAIGPLPGIRGDLKLNPFLSQQTYGKTKSSTYTGIDYKNIFDDGAGSLTDAGTARKRGAAADEERRIRAAEDSARLRQARLERGANADRLLDEINQRRAARAAGVLPAPPKPVAPTPTTAPTASPKPIRVLSQADQELIKNLQAFDARAATQGLGRISGLKPSLVSDAEILGIPVGPKDTKKILREKISAAGGHDPYDEGNRYNREAFLQQDLLSRAGIPVDRLNVSPYRDEATGKYTTTGLRGQIADIEAAGGPQAVALAAQRKLVEAEIQAAGSVDAYILARREAAAAALKAATSDAKSAEATSAATASETAATNASTASESAAAQSTRAQTALDRDLAQAKAARTKSELDSAAKNGTAAPGISVGTADPSSAAMITAQGEKAAAAHLVAEALLKEAISADKATIAQEEKAAAAKLVADALMRQLGVITGGTATAAVPGAAIPAGVGGIAPTAAASAAAAGAKKTKPPVPTNARDRVAEAKRQVKDQTNKDLLEASILSASNNPSTKIGAESLNARRTVGLEQALNAIIEQRIKLEAEIFALRGRSKSQVAKQAAQEAELSGINLSDQNAVLRERATQGIAVLEGEKLVLLAQENALIQKIVGAQLARISINAKIVDAENQNAAYASLSASQKRRKAQADAQASVDSLEQNAARSVALNSPALRNRVVDAKATTATADAELKALTDAEIASRRRALLARDPAYKNALTEAAADKAKIGLIEQEISLRAKILAANSLTAAQSEASAVLQLEANLIKVAEQKSLIKAQLASGVYAKEEAELAVLQRQINEQKRKEYRKAIRSSAGAGLPITERLGLRSQGPGGGGGGGGGGNFMSSLGTTARYGASSFLLFGALGGLAASVKVAEELERTLNLVQSQFESLYDQNNFGGAEQAFERFRGGILEIAAVTGTSADEVANLAFQFQGAFGGNTVKTLSETQAAIQAVKVTGLSLKETIDAFTALTQSYREQGVTISDVTDKALGLQERFGVLAKETISFAADLAPVGESAGFTLDQLEALGATAQKFSGKSGSSLAEAFGRIIPQVQANSLEFVTLFRRIGEQVPEFADALPDATAALGDNDVQKFFEILIPIYGKLGQAQKNYILDLVGSRRETQSLVGVLENGDELLSEWNGSFNDAGKASERFGVLQETLTQRLARFGEQMKQIGVAVFEGGLGDALKELINALSLLGTILGGTLGIIGTVLTAFGGMGTKVLIAAAAMKVLLTVSKAVSGLSFFSAASTALAGPQLVAAQRATAAYGIFGGAANPNNLSDPARRYLLGAPNAPVPGRLANATTRVLPTVGPGLVTAGNAVRGAGSAAAAAFGGPVGVAAIFGLIGFQAISGMVEGAREGYAQEADAFFSEVVERAKRNREEGVRGYAALDPGTEGFQNIVDVASGKVADESSGAYFFGDTSNIGEAAGNTLTRLNLDITNTFEGQRSDAEVRAQMNRSDAENEQIKRARKALVELEAENFTQNLIELSSIAGEPGTGLLLASDSLYDVETGANLVSAATGSTRPEDVIAGLKADAQARGEKLDLSKIGGKIRFDGEDVAFTAEDVQGINLKNQAEEALTERETKIFTALRTQLSDKEIEELPQVVQDAINNGLTAAELDSNLADLDLKAVDFGKAFERGDITLGTYLGEVQKVADSARELQGNDKKTAAEYAAKTEEIRKARLDAIKADFESLKLANELTGGDSGDLIQPILAQLQNTELGKAERADLVSQYFTAQREVLDKMVADADSTAEAIAIGQRGIAVDPAIQFEFVRQQLANSNTSFQDLLRLIGYSTEVNNQITDEVARRVVETGETLTEATAAIVKANLVAAVRVYVAMVGTAENFAQILAAKKTLDDAVKALGSLQGLEDPAEISTITKGPPTKQQEDQRRQEQFDIAKSRIDLAKARAGGNTVLQAQLQRQAAEIDLAEARANGSEAGVNRALGAIIEADRSGAEAVLRIQQAKISYFKVLAGANGTLNAQLDRQSAEIDLRIAQSNGDEAGVFAAQGAIEASFRAEADAASNDLKARLELQKARNGGDALANAKIDQQLADIDLQIAQRNGDIAGEAQALARRIEADRSVQNAMLAMREAQISVMLAQANALDDTVKAAELGVEQAQIALQKAQISGDPNAIKEAEAQIITANDALHDTQLRESIDAQQFLFDMGKISRGQFVEYLKGLIGMAGNSDKDVQAIQRQIKQLQGELSNDFQYNLPTSLGLPTLYESRRVSQATPSYAGALGAGYQDNRNVQININVTNSADQATVLAVIDSALGTPTTGTVPRRY